MRRPFTMALLGLCMALGSSSLLQAQQIQPISYDDLVARLANVESELTAIREAGPAQDIPLGPDQLYSDNASTRGGLFISYENVWIKPYFNHNAAYEIFDVDIIPGGNINPISENSRVVEFDWGFRSTPRVELGYIVPGSGLGWRARYWQFDSTTSARAADPFVANGSPGRIEVGLHDDPDIQVSTGDNEAVRATDSLRLTVIDAEGMWRHESDCNAFTVSGGLRYLRKEQNYRAELAAVTTGIIDNIVVSDTFFEGVGPTLALEGVRRLGGSSMSVFGKGRGSLLLGDSGLQQADVDPQDLNSPIDDFFTTENSVDFQLIAELQIGLQYDRTLCSGKTIFGRIGAELQYWPSAGSASYQNGEDSATAPDPRDADMLLFGLSAEVGTRW